jgi:hypothetical protein
MNRPVHSILGLCLAGAFLTTSLAAQEPEQKTEPGKVPAAAAPTVVKAEKPPALSLGQTFSLAPGEHDLGELVDKAATVLGRNILWQDTERAAAGKNSLRVTLHNPVKVTPQAFEELLSSLLYTQGFAIVPVDAEKGFYEVISLFGQRAREVMNRAVWRTPEEVLARPNQREFVLTTVRLAHTNATVATNALRPFFNSAGGPQGTQLVIGNVGNNEAMLIAGFTDQVCSAIRLVRACDQPPTQPPDPAMMGPGGQNAFAALQAQVKALQEQVAELQKAVGIAKK